MSSVFNPPDSASTGQTTSDANGNSLEASAALDLEEVKTSLIRQVWPTLRYLTTTEVHTYAFSVAANAILSLFPAIILMLVIARRIFHSETMVDVILQMLRQYMPSNQDFIAKNMDIAAQHRLQWFPIAMLFISSTGIFLPLEVALNRIWGIKKNRSYLGNQLVALGLATMCGLLALGSVGGTTFIAGAYISSTHWFWSTLAFIVINVFTIPASIIMFFLIYWLLPNGKVPARAVIPSAIITGVLFEISRHLYKLVVPHLNFRESYGPFYVSVTLIFWAFLCGMLLLGGAYLSAAEHVQANLQIDQE